ncbi:AAA family ATPase [Sorangium sp. So ce233]|uniref:AAA family ATPase n=1 Tax=Sorangium sp. So ce233 TaxID=3133290 RepID=UPI003F5F98A1
MTVQEIHVAGYRSIREMTLPLAQVNVIVGPNGVGKTNLYRTMVLLGSAASGGFARTLAEEGGMPSVLWAGQRSKGPVRMTLRVRLDQLVYELQCGLTPPPAGPFALDPDIKEENLWLLDKRRRLPMLERAAGSAFARDVDGHRVTFPFSLWGSESVLAQVVEPHRFPLLSAVRQQLMNFRFYHHFRTDSGAPLRVEQVGVRTPVLSTDGHDLAAALATILDIGDRGALKDAISSAFPGASLEVSSTQGRFRVELGLPGMSRPLDAREFSDGTARYLCLLAALLSPRPPLLMALNEPETSLHPDLLGPLGDLLVHAASRSQLWITTHSRPLAERIRKATPCRLIELGKRGGETVLAGGAAEDE